MKKRFLAGLIGSLLLVLCISAALAGEPVPDPAENLAARGLDPEEILLAEIGFLPEDGALRYPFRDRPFYLWYDITGDGCVDLFTERMVGSGMVRVDLRVYDPVTGERYILDGYDYYFLLEGISEGRVRVLREGPYGYGKPLVQTRGTVILDDGRLIFVAGAEPSRGGDDPFDTAVTAVSAEQAVWTALDFVKAFPKSEYCNQVAADPVLLEEEGTKKACWKISFQRLGMLRYVVWVNAETGEVEDCFDAEKDAG